MNIAIIGSRDGIVLSRARNALYSIGIDHLKDVTIISGGAKGIDQMAKQFAEDEHFNYEEIRPINPANKLDYLFRNVEIITKADKIIALWNGTSKGTKFVIDYAKARNKNIIIIQDEIRI